uniref:Putative secreted protein n=1 Tax=Ixodes ricinus TaxID=34613 RepID=A0A6B0U4Y3_IXORI
MHSLILLKNGSNFFLFVCFTLFARLVFVTRCKSGRKHILDDCVFASPGRDAFATSAFSNSSVQANCPPIPFFFPFFFFFCTKHFVRWHLLPT